MVYDSGIIAMLVDVVEGPRLWESHVDQDFSRRGLA